MAQPPFRFNDTVISISFQPQWHISNICEPDGQRTTDRKWPMGNQMVTWPSTSRDPERSN